MYNRSRSYRRHSAGLKDYLMPFLIIIAVGVILVLFVNLFRAVFGERDVNAAYLHIVEGSVDMKTWGADDYIALSSDALVLQGDEVYVSADGRVIVEFVDGTLVRLDGGTDIIFEEFGGEPGAYVIDLMFVNGGAWVNKLSEGARATELSIAMPTVTVRSGDASVFEVESDLDDTVRGIRGKDVKVDVLDREGAKVLVTEELGIGQEIVFIDEALDRYWEYQSPEVITVTGDLFRASAWYEWNTLEDESPSVFAKSVGGQQFVKVEPEVLAEADEPVDEPVDEELDAEVEESEPEEELDIDLGPLGVTAITSVSGGTQTDENGFYVVQNNPAVIKGSTSGAAKIVVNNYTLQAFNPGDTTWTYYANADYEYMYEGENTYEVYAYDADDNPAEVLVVKVLYQPKVEEPEEEEEEIQPLFGP